MSGARWVTEPEGVLEPILTEDGPASTAPVTVITRLQNAVEKWGDENAISQKRPKNGENINDVQWTHWTWREYYNETIRFAKSLIHLDFAPHRCVNILGFNSPEWFFADLGAIAAGGIAAGIYATNLPDACQYISEHSQAEVVVVEGEKQLNKYLQIAQNLPALKAIVVYGGEVADDIECTVPVYSWDAFLELGNGVTDEAVQERIDAQLPGHCCTLIYTSGTTGPPKAVMISHDNITWTAELLAVQLIGIDDADHMISYLPLSHIAAQMLDIHCPVTCGVHVWFAQPDALKGSLGGTMKEVRPTIFFGVPRVWEKIYEKMQQIGKTTKGLKKKIATWAKGKGTARAKMLQYGASGGTPSCFGCAHSLVLGKVKAALGLDRVKACFTAAAPISRVVLDYFASLDIQIYEVFGQSECTGPHTVNFEGQWKIGTCGRPMPGTESRIAEGTDELCYRGRHIFMGYMYMPDKTAETIDDEGWLHSGDVATFDDDEIEGMNGPSGFMKITGRIKELIITAGGENIPPVLIEKNFKKVMPALANCMAIGDQRKYLTMLLCLHVKVDENGVPTNELTGEALHVSKEIGSDATTTEQVMEDEAWRKYFDDGLAAANELTTSRAQKIQKWALLPTDFSEPGGELTPTLKLKRSVAQKKYADVIESLYA